MDAADVKADCLQYLRAARRSIVRGLNGLTEYDSRRPLTPSGTNVLGLVKHLAGIEIDYLGTCVGRPFPVSLPWVEDGSIWAGADMWATATESRGFLVGLYRRAWRHSDESIEALALDAPATVPWWPDNRRRTTVHHLLVRVIAETAQHAGHVDILRETIDGRGGADRDDLGDDAHWSSYVATVEAAAAAAAAETAETAETSETAAAGAAAETAEAAAAAAAAETAEAHPRG